MMTLIKCLCMVTTILICGTACAQESLKGDLAVFHAGSLSVPFKEIGRAFMAEHPGVKVLLEAAGSRTCARKISDLNRPCDVMASADYTVIDTLLIPKHAAWNIKFVSNEMVITYAPKSRHASEITSSNWYEILCLADVAYGRSDPNSDPCGYRSVLVAKLAETHYGVPGLAERLLGKDRHHIRPKETDLLGLLEIGEIDFLFIYRSVAEQHGLKYVTLPDEINLKKPGLPDRYARASVEISGTKPGTSITKRGMPMVYGVTIPSNTPNPAAAEAFMKFLLHPDKGMAIMAKHGQPSVIPAPSDSYENIPQSLKEFASKP